MCFLFFYLHFVGQLVVSCAFLFVLDCNVLSTPPCYFLLFFGLLISPEFVNTPVANVC